jgi:small ligand-binding sensory domain FIST
MLMSGGFDVYHAIMHGCTPLDGQYLTITKKEGPFIYEIDGRPVCEMIDEVYGSTAWRKQTPVNFLTIGVNNGEKFADFAEENYVNRLIAGALQDGKGICMFEADLDEGTQVQFMLRDSMQMIESVKLNTKKIFNQIEADHQKPCFGIYIDCAGRASLQSNTATEEAACVQKIFNERNIPLLGFYSGVEIAPFQGSSRGLDWTGVLIIFAEE